MRSVKKMDYYDDYQRAVYPTVGEILLYTVKKGDNPYRIAQTFNTDVKWVLAMNNLKKDQYIYPNQQLLIPVVYQKPMPMPPKPPITGPGFIPKPPRPQPREELERNQYDMFF